MKCNNCGEEIIEGAKCCTSCGTKVSVETLMQSPKKYSFISPSAAVKNDEIEEIIETQDNFFENQFDNTKEGDVKKNKNTGKIGSIIGIVVIIGIIILTIILSIRIVKKYAGKVVVKCSYENSIIELITDNGKIEEIRGKIIDSENNLIKEYSNQLLTILDNNEKGIEIKNENNILEYKIVKNKIENENLKALFFSENRIVKNLVDEYQELGFSCY